MAKIIHILPHNIEDFMSGDYSNFDHHLTRFIGKVEKFWKSSGTSQILKQELWVLSKKTKNIQEIYHKNGFLLKIFPISIKMPLPLEISFPLMNAVNNTAKSPNTIFHLHSYYLWMNDFLGLILSIKKTPFFVHFRGGGFSTTKRGFLYSFYHHLIGLRLSLGLCKIAFIQNKNEIKRVRKWGIISQKKIFYFPNSMPYEEICHKANWEFLKTGILKTVIAGRTSKITHREENITSLSNILKKFPNFNLEIIGLKEGNGQLDKLKENYPKKLTLTSWISKKELLEKFKNSDLLLFLTEREGSPMALIEAQSQGLPVISFDVEGVRDIISNGVNGYLIQNVKELESKIENIFNDPQIIKKMSLSATQNVIDNFIDEKYFPKLIELYKN